MTLNGSQIRLKSFLLSKRLRISQVQNGQVPSTQSGTDEVFECQDCDYVSKWALNVRRHSNIKHDIQQKEKDKMNLHMKQETNVAKLNF